MGEGFFASRVISSITLADIRYHTASSSTRCILLLVEIHHKPKTKSLASVQRANEEPDGQIVLCCSGSRQRGEAAPEEAPGEKERGDEEAMQLRTEGESRGGRQ